MVLNSLQQIKREEPENVFTSMVLVVEFMLKAIYDALCGIADIEQVTEQVTEQVEKLLKVVGDKEYSTKELMELLGLKHRPTFRNNYLLPALELAYFEMTIPDKPNSSKQKYRKVKR